MNKRFSIAEISTSKKADIVGLHNVEKSTIFNAVDFGPKVVYFQIFVSEFWARLHSGKYLSTSQQYRTTNRKHYSTRKRE
ncbi:Hypothetical predicted protein [Olea europaea subsp. europaea]|uniref:Uncharacterized protein n=1 Tax=Olea europaea subsp. europaea TaxID=158383 RepID=A0A8S0SC50_OLEEU|nr:Hypothetical predicted protein [Olea europaea subsp. europaea]